MPGKIPRFKCHICGVTYVDSTKLKAHAKNKRNNELELGNSKKTKCIYPGCEELFYHKSKMATVPILDTMINEYQSFNKAHQGAVNNASQIPKHRFQKEVEIVERIKHTLQKDTNSFGVYCCFFAF